MKLSDKVKGFCYGMSIASLVALIMGGIGLFQELRSLKKDMISFKEKVKIEMGDIRAVSDELMLFQKIEDYWFEHGRDYMDDKTLRFLSRMTYKYHMKYSSSGEIPIGLDYWKIFAWVEVESNFDPDAESYAGAIGLTQQMFITAIDGLDRYFGLKGLTREKIFEYLYDPLWNFRLGLEQLIEYQLGFMAAGVASKDDWKLTFSLYNWSTDAVSKLIQAKKKGTPKASLRYALEIEKRTQTYYEK